MASRKRLIAVILARETENELEEIYRYNLTQRGIRTAESYLAFLRTKIANLSHDKYAGKLINGRPDLRYLLMKKRSAGDGHLAVYSIDDSADSVEILHVFHTKQDWQNKL